MNQPAAIRRVQREAYYRRIAAKQPDAAVGSDVLAGAGATALALCADDLALRGGAALADGVGAADLGAGGGAPRADPGEPGPAGLLGHHAVALRGPAAHPARRDCAQPPSHAVGAAPDRRGQRRLHRGRGRARDHASGRFHHHAVLDLARSRQSSELGRWSGWTDWTFRSCVSSTAASPRTTRRTTQPVSRPEGDALARYGNNLLPVDYEPQAESSPVFAYPYARTRESLEHLRRSGRATRRAWPQDAVRQSGDRWLRHAHDGCLRAAAARRIRGRAAIAARMAPCSMSSRATAR